MRLKKTLLALNFIALGVLWQTSKAQMANVVILAPKDAQEVATVYLKLAAAQTDWQEERKMIAAKYRLTPSDPEWAYGFTFSNDFKAVVPAQPPK